MKEDDVPVKLEGLNVDAVYENFVKQITNFKTKIKREKQLNKQMQWNKKMKLLKGRLESI